MERDELGTGRLERDILRSLSQNGISSTELLLLGSRVLVALVLDAGGPGGEGGVALLALEELLAFGAVETAEVLSEQGLAGEGLAAVGLLALVRLQVVMRPAKMHVEVAVSGERTLAAGEAALVGALNVVGETMPGDGGGAG